MHAVHFLPFCIFRYLTLSFSITRHWLRTQTSTDLEGQTALSLMSNFSKDHVTFVTNAASRPVAHCGGLDTDSHAGDREASPAGNASDHSAIQVTSMKIDGEDDMQKSPAGEVGGIKTHRALLPRQRAAETETHSRITPKNGSKANGAGATTSSSSKGKITIVACQECQRKKCKVCLRSLLKNVDFTAGDCRYTVSLLLPSACLIQCFVSGYSLISHLCSNLALRS